MARKRTSVKAEIKRLRTIAKVAAHAERPGTPAEGEIAKAKLKQLGATPHDIQWGRLAVLADERKAALRQRKAETRTRHTAPAQRQPEPKAAEQGGTGVKTGEREHLTDRIVKQLHAPERGNKVTYDSAVKGFGIRITAAGGRAFVLNYRRKADQIERRYTIGSFPDWSTSAARDEAKRLKREIDGGADPVDALRKSRAAETVADLADRFLKEHVPHKRPATQRDYIQQIKVDIVPALGRMKVATVSYSDIDSLHREISARAPTHANRVLALLSRMFSLAVLWKLRTDNPVKGIARNQEHKRERYLKAAELARLTAALDKLHDQGAANAVRLLLLTGARRGELLAARWDDIDLDTGVWVKPGATTKRKTVHRVPLSAAACQLLAAMKQQADSEWLFPARFTPHRLDIDDAWGVLRKTARIPDARLHHLRHTYASVLVSAGLSLPIIGALLGHTTAQTTLRYSHLFDDPLRAATERAAAVITGTEPAEVVPMPVAQMSTRVSKQERVEAGPPLDELIAFTKWLESLARAASSPDEPLSKKLTDEERQFLQAKGETFSDAVNGLVKIIADQPYQHAREHGFRQLWAALGSAVVIGCHATMDSIRERIQNESAAKARLGRQKISRDRGQIIARLAAEVREQHPEWKESAVADAVAQDLGSLDDKYHLGAEAVRKTLRAHRRVPK
jgi:integrase